MRRVAVAGVAAVAAVVIAAIVFAVVQANTPRRTPGVTAGISASGYAWGLSSQTGITAEAANAGRSAPRRISLPTGTTALASGAAGFAALADGRLWIADGGSVAMRKVALPDGDARAVSGDVGTGFYVVADADGHVYAWGGNALGELGNGSRTSANKPTRVAIPTTAHVSSVAAGAHFAVAITDTGAVYAWGSNSEGQLGDGGTTDSTKPVRVDLPDLNGDRIVRVAAGARHALALTRSGRVLAWGSNVLGQRATTSSRPAVVRLDRPAMSISAGYGFSVAVLDDGTARSWGDNADGELGIGSTRSGTTPTVVRLQSRRLTEVVAGDRFVVGIASDGSCVAWGDGSGGQLGDGSTVDRTSPVAVALPRDTKVRAVATSSRSVLALDEPTPVDRVSVVAQRDGVGRTIVVSAIAHSSQGVSLGPVSAGALRVRIADGTCRGVSCTAPRNGSYEVEARIAGTDVRGRTIVTIGSSVRTGAVLHRLPETRTPWWIWVSGIGGGLVVLIGAATITVTLRRRDRRTVEHV